MLNLIKYQQHVLQLRDEDTKKHIFDIGSISLLIGPNGSGKTRFLQAIVTAFDSEASYRSNSCELYLDRQIDFRPAKNLWGVIYYTPAQNRPTFRAHDDFVDASKVPAKNLFELVEHKQLFTDFGVELKLVARATIDYRRACKELAAALIANRTFRAADTSHEFDKAAKAREELNSITHYTHNQDAVLKMEEQDRTSHAEMTEKIIEDFRDNCPERKDLAAAMLVIEYMFPTTNIGQILQFAKNTIGSKYISSTLNSGEFSRYSNLRRIARKQLQQGKLESTDSHFNYTYVIKHPIEERHHFENHNVANLFSIELDNISSGEWALLNQIIALHESIEKLGRKQNLMVLIDEGDAFLHLNWQRQYIYQMNRFLKKCQQRFAIGNIQLIVASHSPMLASDIPRSFICHMSSDTLDRTHPPSFAAPLQSILNMAFEASTMGEFATLTINETIANLRKKCCSERDNYVISIIDDPTIKRVLTEMRDEIIDTRRNDRRDEVQAR
ncbi:hypothetical protein PS718_00967 [Pseudomonas fluorescens]|uniref:ATPase AAA-type core domain-containing protein n=1 Tax=Pseudomonas fluorescens TaxID=294 RepID=A0A5E7AL67_PSEFL|nr:AAA family ATPase [Pseudomonas fluorescens]VVN79235.1 hypothetical protein PS718_00967 [Pseudomonas fluorescens]